MLEFIGAFVGGIIFAIIINLWREHRETKKDLKDLFMSVMNKEYKKYTGKDL